MVWTYAPAHMWPMGGLVFIWGAWRVSEYFLKPRQWPYQELAATADLWLKHRA